MGLRARIVKVLRTSQDVAYLSKAHYVMRRMVPGLLCRKQIGAKNSLRKMIKLQSRLPMLQTVNKLCSPSSGVVNRRVGYLNICYADQSMQEGKASLKGLKECNP